MLFIYYGSIYFRGYIQEFFHHKYINNTIIVHFSIIYNMCNYRIKYCTHPIFLTVVFLKILYYGIL